MRLPVPLAEIDRLTGCTFQLVGLGAIFTRHAISPIEVVGCATFPQELVQSDSTNKAFAATRGALVTIAKLRSGCGGAATVKYFLVLWLVATLLNVWVGVNKGRAQFETQRD
jgi:hypothetical protein